MSRHLKRSAVALPQDAPALVVANSAHQILFATPNARTWLQRFFRGDQTTDLLPPRISRWLERGAQATGAEVRARSKGASLLVRKYVPEPGECTALFLHLADGTTPQAPAGDRLSQRQQDVLRWVASGKSNKAIAAILKISPKTVGKHVENVFRKLGVTSRVAAANAYAGYKGGRD